jgi:RHS repeat-associated protein
MQPLRDKSVARNVAPGSNAAYNVYMEKDGAQTPLTQTPVTGETVMLTGTDVKLPWCNQAPGGGTETLSVVAVDSTASTSVALPPGSCYDNGTGIAWVYSYQYYATDHLGTVRAAYTVAADGTTNLQTFAYEPFGVEIVGATPDTCDNTHKYTGHERDLETGNDYMHYRFYAAGMGRFMKPDALMGNRNNPQTFDLYAYVQGNPLNRSDPSGEIDIYGYENGKVVRSDAAIAQFEKARAYLSKSPEGARLMDKLESIQGAKEPRLVVGTGMESKYVAADKTIYWNPNSGNDVSHDSAGKEVPKEQFTRDSKGGTIQTPALSLLHEADHAVADEQDHTAYRGRTDQLVPNQGDPNYNLEEQRVIEGSEATVAQQLDEPTRDTHDTMDVTTEGPTSKTLVQ